MTTPTHKTRRHLLMGVLWAIAGIAVLASNQAWVPELQGTANAATALPASEAIEEAVELAERLDFNPAQAPLAPAPQPQPQETILPLLPSAPATKTSAPAAQPAKPAPLVRDSNAAPLGSASPLQALQKVKAAATADPKPSKKKKKKAKLDPCVKELRLLANRARVPFGPASAEVDLRGQELIAALAGYLADCPQARVTVEGFTDPSGDPKQNLALSWMRANNVTSLLVAAGVNPEQLKAFSHMEDHPAHCQHFDLVDRRVEFRVAQIKG